MEQPRGSCPCLARVIVLSYIMQTNIEEIIDLARHKGLICHWFFFTGSVVVPEEGTLNWWTFLGHTDPRLHLTKSSSPVSYLPQLGALNTVEGVNLLELLLMASKAAYENEEYVNNAVTNYWKVRFCFLHCL